MDPSIIKLMEEEENEDESMHSGAEVEAFQAALNRGIGGGNAQPSVLSSETNQKQQVAPLVTEIKPNDVKHPRDSVQRSPLIQISDRIPMRISEPERVKILGAQSHYLKVQNMGNQQNMGVEQRSNQKNQGNSVLLASLLPVLKAYLDKDRYMQLQTLFNRLRKGEIVKEEYVRLMKSVAGDHLLRVAIAQLQSQPGPNQSQLRSQASAPQHNVRMPVSATVSSAVQVQSNSSYPSAENNAQKPREMERQPHSHGMQGSQLSSCSTTIFSQNSVRSSISEPGRSKEQHLQFPQKSFTMCSSNSGTYQPYSGTNVNTSGSSMKPQSHDLISHPVIGATQKGGSTQAMTTINLSKFQRPNYVTDPKRVQSGSAHTVKYQNSVPWQPPTNKEQNSAPFSSTNYVKQGPVEQDTDQQQKSLLSNSQVLSASSVERGTAVTRNLKDDSLEMQSSKVGFSTPSSMESSNTVSASIATQMDPNIKVGSLFPSVAASAGDNARTPPKKPSIGEKKPFEALGFSPPMSSKKQKVSAAFLDQSIEQLNDVTAVSGVNLREEEELLSGSMKDSRVSEASRRVVQKEEERLILRKTPLQKKLAEIMVKCGLKNINPDVERCLSLCVEERMRGLISTLITLSKQRVDAEKPRHPTVMASDVRQQILKMNQEAREEWEKKQAEAEMLQKVNEAEGANRVEGDNEKDKGCMKLKVSNSCKTNEEDDKMRATAANVAARAAVGGDDMLSKWQLMAEQARQKHEDGKDAASGSQPVKDATGKSLSTSGKTTKDGQEPEKRNPAVTSMARKFGRNQEIVPQTRVSHSISVKDVISALEREPQMSKSTLIYQLYLRTRSNALIE